MEATVRNARIGAVAWIVGAVQFMAGMAVAQLAWTTPYSLLNNYISDLGAVSCGYWPAGSSRYICSPWHSVFNGSAVVLGLLFILGTVLVVRAFPPTHVSRVGLCMIAVAGAGAIGVGLSPEDVNLLVHSISALVAFAIGNLAIIALGYAVSRDPAWKGYRIFGVACGTIGLVGLVWYLSGFWGPLGLGGTERLIVAPILLWAVVVGLHIVRGPRASRSRMGAPS